MRGAALLFAAVLTGLAAVPAGAEIVVLANGYTIVSTGHRAEGNDLLLTLAGGGEVRVGASDVAQVLPDEIVPQEPAPAPSAAAAGPSAADWAAVAADTARRHRVDAGLVAAVIAVESGFQPSAVSPKGAMGLMQLMPTTAAKLGVANPFDPLQNIDGGVRHLRDLLTRYRGDRRLALAAYNAGAAAVDLHGGVPPFAETRAYVRKVLARCRQVRQ